MTPVVFVSSAVEDRKLHREQAEAAAIADNSSPRMMESFPASGDKPSRARCLEMVGQAEAVVAIVARRCGWAPAGPSNANSKRITWLEGEHAGEPGKEVLVLSLPP